jgi:pilus assembly protein CpaE
VTITLSVVLRTEGGVAMLRAVIISPSRSLADELQPVLASLPIAVVRVVEHYPTENELLRLLRSLTPQLILLSVESLQEAVAVVRGIETHAPGVPVVAAGQRSGPEVLLEMRAGVREFLQSPFEPAAVQEALERVREAAERAPRPVELADRIFSFLPCKAGVGTSTVALNMSAAFARAPDTSVLLMDFDLNCGMIGFMLKLENPHSVTHAAEIAFQMDENLWRQLISSCGALDVLPAGKINPGVRIEPAQIRSLLDFARRHYKVICLDLSGNLEKYSVEIMRESKQIFLVCTAELPSLHLARQKLSFLRSLDMEDTVQVLLNRVGKRDVVSPEEVEKLLGLTVCTFPNDYRGIHEALATGKPVKWDSPLGKRFLDAAQTILSGSGLEEPKKRRFVEHFSLVPASHTLFPGSK